MPVWPNLSRASTDRRRVTRTIEVGPDRVDRWVAGFAERHGKTRISSDDGRLLLAATDGCIAALATAFCWQPDDACPPLEDFLSHVRSRRLFGLVLVRLGGYAAGLVDGTELVASKVGSRPVHGRSAAGGWSQHRFARRREGQARVALTAAADTVAAVLLPRAADLDAVVSGGDRQALRTALADPRLAALRPLLSSRILDVPDPKAAVLRAAVRAAVAIRVTLTEPDSCAPDSCEPGSSAEPDSSAE